MAALQVYSLAASRSLMVLSVSRSTISLADFLKERGKAGIANVDTRAITRRLRDTGALNGVITSDASIRSGG